MENNFKLIVKQSDINKLDREIKKKKVDVITIGDIEYCYMKTKMDYEKGRFTTLHSIWPRSWGYASYKDGYCAWVDTEQNRLKWYNDTLLALEKNPLDNDCCTIEIDKTK